MHLDSCMIMVPAVTCELLVSCPAACLGATKAYGYDPSCNQILHHMHFSLHIRHITVAKLHHENFATATAIAAWNCASTQSLLRYCDEVLLLLLQLMAVVAAVCWFWTAVAVRSECLDAVRSTRYC
jgi:hypothetical protein